MGWLSWAFLPRAKAQPVGSGALLSAVPIMTCSDSLPHVASRGLKPRVNASVRCDKNVLFQNVCVVCLHFSLPLRPRAFRRPSQRWRSWRSLSAVCATTWTTGAPTTLSKQSKSRCFHPSVALPLSYTLFPTCSSLQSCISGQPRVKWPTVYRFI